MPRKCRKSQARRLIIAGLLVTLLAYSGFSSLRAPLRIVQQRLYKELGDSASGAVKKTYLGCQQVADAQHVVLQNTSAFMTVDWCAATCYSKSYYYALLEGGNSCYCSFISGTGSVILESSCASPCPGNSKEVCGGDRTVSVYLVRNPDGNREWTEWMTLEDSTVASRYRGCNRTTSNGTCHISLERRYESPLETWEKNIHLYFIGCFTLGGFNTAAKRLVQNDWPAAATECLSHCWFAKKRYMAFQTVDTTRWCMCVPEIGTSLPTDSCTNQYGVQLFSTGKIHASVTLYFTAPQIQRKALLLGTHYGGLSHIASLVSRYPKTFYVDQPDSLLDSWSEEPAETTAFFLNKVLDPLFRCDIRKLPGIFLFKYRKSGQGNGGFGYYSDCSQLFFSATGIDKCLPALEEACKLSSLVAAKTTRPLDALLLSAFVNDHLDLYFLHMVRDPRGIIGSRITTENVRHDPTFGSFALSVCTDILRISDFFRMRKDTHHMVTVHYEDLMISPRNASSDLYRNLALPADDPIVADILISVFGNSTGAAALQASAFKWQVTFDKTTIALIDRTCSDVYAHFPDRYKEFLKKPIREFALKARPKDVLPV